MIGGAKVRKKTGIMLFFALIIYYIYTFGYSFVSQFFSWTKEEWYTIATIIMTGGWLLYREYSKRQVTQGTVTQDGVRFYKSDVIIPFQKIAEITAERNDTAVISTFEGEAEVRLSGRELVKLAEAGFMRWSIVNNKAHIRPGLEEDAFYATYSPTGKYAGSAFIQSTVAVSLCAMIILFFIGEPGLVFIPGIICLLLILGIDDYKEVEVTIEGHKMRLRDENLVDHNIGFDEVDWVEIGLLRTKITAKDGRVFFFPRALFLLPEFVELFAGLRKK